MTSRWTIRLLSLMTAAMLAAIAWYGTQTRFGVTTKHHPAGVLVASPPAQYPTANPAIDLKGFRVTPRAQFQITARVLSKKRYRFDKTADLVPYDFALGWGVMSDTAVLDRLTISQSGRWYFWSTQGPLPADPGAIVTSSANMHLIPIDGAVRRVLDNAVKGDVITLTGDLVDLAGAGITQNTSLTRSDTGGGACEIILVRTASVQGTTA
jgi:hypothetical protein